MVSRRYTTTGWLLSAVGIFILINLLAGSLLRSARLDLTENRLYTLSEGTGNILRHLDSPITLKLFWSEGAAEDLPGLKVYSNRVQDLLDEYAAVGGGRLTVDVIDPEPFSEAEDEAVRFGLQGVPVNSSETLYFGLVGIASDERIQSISFLQPDRETFLEYDITRLIYSLAHPEQKRIGLMSSLPLSGGPAPGNPFAMNPPWVIFEQMGQLFDVQRLSEDVDAIPEGIDVLMVVHPAEFSESTLYAIDQFVLTGGRLVVFADPLSESAAAGNPSSALAQEYPPDRLLRSWGVVLEAGKVVGDLTFAQRVNYPGRSRPRAGNYLPWLALPEQAVNQDEIATINLKQINMATAGSLQRTEDAATDFIPLIRSSDKAMLIEKHRVAFAPDPAGLMAEFSPTGEVYTLAARVTGRVKTAFPDGPPEEGSDSGKGGGTAGEDRVVQRGHIEESEVPANIVIIADADLLEDRFWVDVRNFFGQRIAFPMADNADFVVNVLEQLGGSGDLIGIRSRGPSSRPFTRVEEIRREAERKHLAKERELLARLDETERKLNELQRMREDPDSPALTPEQEQEVERFRGEKVKIRQELREVQYQLRREIERLEVWLKFINILLVPVLISLTATGAWIVRRRRDRGFSA